LKCENSLLAKLPLPLLTNDFQYPHNSIFIIKHPKIIITVITHPNPSQATAVTEASAAGAEETRRMPMGDEAAIVAAGGMTAMSERSRRMAVEEGTEIAEIETVIEVAGMRRRNRGENDRLFA
jgi:hypothetical protein